MTALPLPRTQPTLPLPRFELAADDLPAVLCAGPRLPDASWIRQGDNAQINVWLRQETKAWYLDWTLNGKPMASRYHSTEKWARAEMQDWQVRDTGHVPGSKAQPGNRARLRSGMIVELVAPGEHTSWRSTKRGWVVKPISGHRPGQKRFTVSETEINNGLLPDDAA